MKKLLMVSYELAELYCMKTLYDYYAPRLPEDFRLYFGDAPQDITFERGKAIMGSAPRCSNVCEQDLIIQAYSDLSTKYCKPSAI